VTGNSFSVQVLGFNIAVIADSADALATLRRYVLPSLPANGAASQIEVRVSRREPGFQIECNGMTESAYDTRSLVVQTLRLLDEAIVQRLTDLTAVHAGVVELAGRALLLPGGSHFGKSALVAELLRRGAVYFSDEYALIDANGQTHPYPRPLMLRNGQQDQVPVLPEEWNARVGHAPVPVRWIIALRFDPASVWRITEVPQSQAVLLLLQNTPHAMAEEPRIVEALRRASAGAQCFTGSRSDAATAADHILRLVAA
jgi:hypothetical protein